MKVERARLLSRKYPESAKLLEFYIQLILLQEDVKSTQDVTVYFPRLKALVEEFEPLRRFDLTEETLRGTSEEAKFFARVLLQARAEPAEANGAKCPSCGSKPVVGVMRGEGDGAKRALICSICALEWPYRRLICANCGEEDKEKLPVYVAQQIPHVRVEACDTCRTYLKSVDLTKDGFAVPEVDEIATVALNLWADEHGYTKIETNLLGM
jgi:FdhE protein